MRHRGIVCTSKRLRSGLRGIACHCPIAGSLIQLLVDEAADAVGPEKAEHAHAGCFWVRLHHCPHSLVCSGFWLVVQVEAEEVDRSDERLHAAGASRAGRPCPLSGG